MNIKEIDASANSFFKNHTKVLFFEDTTTNLRGYIAIHTDSFGPATGGTRYYPYTKDEDALSDVLRLSEAMTYKCILSGVPFSGGKAVIIGDPKESKTPELLQAYASIIDSLHGTYTTGTDVGISDEDVLFMTQYTPYILKGQGGGTTTSEMAAYGVYIAICAAVESLAFTNQDGAFSVSLKGLGKLGYTLGQLLYKKGCTLTVSDINTEQVEKFLKEFPGTISVDPLLSHKIKADVYAPCALGNEFTVDTIKELGATIIAGGANNQLASEDIAEILQKQGVWYIPDYVINTGGLIQIVDELDSFGYNKDRVATRIQNIGKTTQLLIERSGRNETTPLYVAKQYIAELLQKK